MRIEPKSQEHRYAARLEWTGQDNGGTIRAFTHEARVGARPPDPLTRGWRTPSQSAP